MDSRTDFCLKFPRASKTTIVSGLIKQVTSDFFVEERMSLELSGEGEHVWLWVEKDGQNTEYVAGQLARFAQVRKMDVGLSGLKDRWAVTRQWFSVYLGNKAEPDWHRFECDGVKVLSFTRHNKKLRRGEHEANFFRIVVRELSQSANLDVALTEVEERGFPNYYGPQRFGFDGANLDRGVRYFEGEIKASKSQRSFYLSAARSYLFNLNLAEHVDSNTWLDDKVGGPLYGDESPGDNELTPAERDILDAHPSLKKGIHKNRLRLERRPYVIVPNNMAWQLDEDKLIVEFELPTGVFASSLLAELFDLSQGLGEGNEGVRRAR